MLVRTGNDSSPATLDCPSFALTPAGLRVHGTPTFDEYERYGQRLFAIANASAWAIGDWLEYGEGRGDFGEVYTQAIDLTRKSYGSLVQALRVSRAFPSEARFTSLSWSHHQAVLGLPTDQRQTLLARAEAQRWNREELREHVRALKGIPQRTAEQTCPKCGWRW